MTKVINFAKKFYFFLIKINLSLNICGYLNVTLDKIHNLQIEFKGT